MRATVVNGRIVLDLVLDDCCDVLDYAERAQRVAALERAWRQAEAGLGHPADEVIGDLRARTTPPRMPRT